MKKRYLKASFTIELSYILFVIFIALVNLLLYVHREKIYTSSAYLLHEMAIELSSREEIFDLENEFDESIKEKYTFMYGSIGGNEGVSLNIKRNIGKVNTNLHSPNIDIKLEQKIFKPVEFMRLVAAIKGRKDEK